MLHMTGTQWRLAKRRALGEVGMTYEELADCARRRDYPSSRARVLWVVIGRTPSEAEPRPAGGQR
jgi:hypothetical protein